MSDKRSDYPRGVIMTPEIIQRIRSKQEAWDREHKGEEDEI